MHRAGVAHSGQGALVGVARTRKVILGRGSIDLARLQVQRGRIGQEGGKDVGGV